MMDEWIDIGREEDWVDVGTGYTSGLATTFGYNDREDNGLGAWGTPTNNPDLVGVSLPVSTTTAFFGNANKAKDALVEVVNPATGKKIIAPIVDKGPAEWVVARQGPTIDLTEGARRALGAGGKTPVQYKILGHETEDQWVDMPGQDVSHGQEVPQQAASTPEGSVSPTYLSDEQLKDKTVKLRTTDPASGEAYEEETDAATAQNLIKGNIDTYSMLMDCLSKS